MTRPTLLAACCLMTLTACGRWMDYTPVRIQTNSAGGASFTNLVRRAHAMGYQVQCQDPRRGTFCVRAHLDQRGRPTHRTSFFHVRVHNSHAVDVSATGYHVRDGATVIHRKLCSELTRFVDGLAAAMAPGAPPPQLLVGLVH